jgi:membrane protein
VLPDAQLRWHDVAVGGFVSALLFTVGKFLIGLYPGRMSIANAYGAAGFFVVLLIWVYYSALVGFFGAEFTQVHVGRYGSGLHPEAHAIRQWRK